MRHVDFTRLKVLILLLVMITSQSSWARRFTNQYCEFELPSGWECSLEGSEWVCQHSNEQSKKEAIIILAAKIKGPQDSLSEYMAYLKTPKSFVLPGGKKQTSEAKYAKSKKINGQNWVDALHMASEVPGFYTRYLATIKEDLGIAVTFSVAKDFYHAYSPLFDKIISSLRVFRQKKKSLAKFRIKRKEEKGFADTTFVPEQVKHDLSKRDSKKGNRGGGGDNLIIIVVAVLAVGGFLIMKKKKGAKPKKKKKKKNS